MSRAVPLLQYTLPWRAHRRIYVLPFTKNMDISTQIFICWRSNLAKSLCFFRK